MDISPVQLFVIGIVFLLLVVGIYSTNKANLLKTKQKIKTEFDRMAEQRDIIGLGNALINPDRYIREIAADAFEKIGIPDIPDIKAKYWIAKGKFDLVTSLGDSAVEPLISALQCPDTEVILGAASALGELGNVNAVQPLIEAIPRIHFKCIFPIATTLGYFKDPIAAKQLTEALQNNNDHVRWVAAYALGEIGDPRALPELKRMREDDKGGTYEGTLKEAAGIAIEKIQWRDRPLELLINALNDSKESIRLGAVDALEKRGGTSSVDALINSLNDSSGKVREAVIKALGNIGDSRAIAPLKEFALKNDSPLRWFALLTIEEIDGIPVGTLISLTNDPDPNTRLRAVKGLGRADDASVIPELEHIINKHQYQDTDFGYRLILAASKSARSEHQETERWNEEIREAAQKGIQDIQQRIKNQ